MIVVSGVPMNAVIGHVSCEARILNLTLCATSALTDLVKIRALSGEPDEFINRFELLWIEVGRRTITKLFG